MVVSRYQDKENISIKVDGIRLEQVEKFKYLGHIITDDGRSDNEIRRRIEIARKNFINMKDVLTTRRLNLETRKRIMRCYVLSTFLYASETWTFSKELCQKVEAFEMWLY